MASNDQAFGLAESASWSGQRAVPPTSDFLYACQSVAPNTADRNESD